MMFMSIIKAWRTVHGFSLRQMAAKTGLSYVTLHRLEKGRPINHKEWARLWRWVLSEEES